MLTIASKDFNYEEVRIKFGVGYGYHTDMVIHMLKGYGMTRDPRLVQAKKHIEAGEHDAARRLLRQMNDSTAQRWLKQLDEKFPAKRGMRFFVLRGLSVLLVTLGGLMALVAVVAKVNGRAGEPFQVLPFAAGLLIFLVGVAMRKYS